MDSHMYQTVGHEAIELVAQALQLPLYRRTIAGGSVAIDKHYQKTNGDEVEDLFELLRDVTVAHPEVKGVCAGAVLSDYQRLRVEHVCARLGLQSLAYLWQRDQDDLVQEMVEIGTVAVLIKVAAIGLAPQKHLGKSLAQMLPTLRRLHTEYDVHVAGEGGEYETLTLDMPLFHSRVVLEETEIVTTDEDPFAPVGYLRVIRAHLEPKEEASRPPIDPDARTALSQRLLFGTPECPKERVYVGSSTIFSINDAVSSAGNNGDTLEPSVTRTTLDLLPCATGGSTADARSYVLAETETEIAMELEEATSSLLTRLRARLQEDGLTLADVRHVNLSVADMAAFGQVNRVYLDFFGQEPPSRVCVQLPLGTRRLLLECLAISPDVCPTPAAHMHVQGISYWAPANIGPYSQAVKANGFLFLAGQIGLQPSTMALVQGLQTQAKQSFVSVIKVLEAHGLGRGALVGGVCFLRRLIDAPQTAAAARAVGAPANALDNTLYLIVPDLPRGAEVEWHMAASVDPSPYTAILHPLASFGDCASAAVSWSVGVQTWAYATLSASAIKHHGLDTASVVAGLIAWLAKATATVQDSWTAAGMSADDEDEDDEEGATAAARRKSHWVQVRLFLRPCDVGEEDAIVYVAQETLLRAFEAAWSATSCFLGEPAPSLALVPVAGMYPENLLYSAQALAWGGAPVLSDAE